MKRPIRMNWKITLCLGIPGICAILLVVNVAAGVRRTLWLKQTHNDFRWIGMALHQYHDRHGMFPPATTRDTEGNSIHSWRSLVQGDMVDLAKTKDDFGRYIFSEPWNSKSNQESIRHHRFGDHPYQFLAVVGPHAAWTNNGVRTIKGFKDGTHNTILAIAVRNTGICWNEPVDVEIPDSGAQLINGRQLDLSKDVFVLTADGSVRYAANGIGSEALPALLTIDGGDTVGEW